MAGNSASTSWLPGGQSAASKAGLGDNNIQKTVNAAISKAQSSAKPTTAPTPGPVKQSVADAPLNQDNAAAAALGYQERGKALTEALKGQQATTQPSGAAGTALSGAVGKLTDAFSQAQSGATEAKPTAAMSQAQLDAEDRRAAWLDEVKDARNGPGAGPGSGSGGGGGTPAAAAPAGDTPEIATPTDYYGDAAKTTGRLTEGVDLSGKIGEADAAWQNATQNFQTEANGILNQLQSVTEQDLANYAASTGQTIADATRQINDIIAGLQDKMQPANAGRVGRVDTVEEENLLNQIVQAQQQASENQIDFAVQQGVNDLTRAEEDAQEQFQTQRDQIAANERQSLDNSALYSEMRGDRGGIGKAQYDSIQNAAATNRLTVNKEQTKLATDTARQIADLRAKGEFTKADEYLKITQEYLGKLMQLKQWADQANISIDEFNIGVDQWEQEYNTKIQQALGELGINATQYSTGLNLDRDRDLQGQRQSLNNALAQYGLSDAQYVNKSDIDRISSILSAEQSNANNKASTEMAAANITGAFSDATPTQQARARAEEQLAEAGRAMLNAGLMPSDAQLSAMGWTKNQFNQYKAMVEAAAKKRGGSGSKASLWAELQALIDAGINNDDIQKRLEAGTASRLYSDAETAGKNWKETVASGYEGWKSIPK